MKKYIVVFFLFLAYGLQAQNREKIDAAPSFTWYGLDFTQARLVGSDADFTDRAKIVSHFFDQWNQLILGEPEKYNLEGTFNKHIINNIAIASRRNAGVDYLKLLADKPNAVSPEDIDAIVKHYSGDEGIGLLFVIENFDKPAVKVRFWVVLFDVKTHKVLMAKQTENKVGGGIGFKNYWASGIYAGLKSIKMLYPGWLKSLN
ncbi:MAG: hypothetical protein V1775_18770 [Bacteroidota bacterium]